MCTYIVAVPPPFLPLRVEKAKLKSGGEAPVRTGASAPSRVSVKNKQSSLCSKIRSFTMKDLFSRERTLKRAILIVSGDWQTIGVCCG